MHERVHAPCFLRRDIGGHVEALYFTREPRGEWRGVDARDRLDATATSQDRRARGSDVTADWRNDSEPGNDYTSLGHTILEVVRAKGWRRRRRSTPAHTAAKRNSGVAAIRDVRDRLAHGRD